MNMILCVDRGHGIGREGELLYHIKDDMKRFKELTKGKVVIMGHNTMESLPNKKLNDRMNIVLSNHEIPESESLKRMRFEDIIDKYMYDDDAFVIGGASIYKLFAEYCKKFYITFVFSNRLADAHFNIFNYITQWGNMIVEDKTEAHYDYDEKVWYVFNDITLKWAPIYSVLNDGLGK